MFYYPTVLNRRTGCFSTIWLVATKGVKVPRRDFLKVNVKSTCDDIMSYVLEQVPPPQPGLPRPRFSLYLSSQLQYGVVLVYHRQCAILLEEIHSILGRLLKPRVSQKIDLDDQVRQALDLPDALALLAEAEGALDPFFGVMSPWYLPGPNTLIEMGREYQREASAERPEPVSLAYVDVSAATSAITASPDTITLRETEPVAFLLPEFEGEDFVDQHPDTLDILLAQTDHFPDGDMEIPREEAVPAEPEREREREREMERTRREAELRGSTLELQPSVLPSEDTALLAQEETGLPAERPRPPGDQQTPVSGPVLPSPPPAAMGRGRAALKRTWRKKQLVFIDLETQLSDDVVKKQISDPQTETRRPPRPPPPPQTKSSAAELLNNPCALLPEEILFLWRRAATVTFLPGWDLQVRAGRVESSDSDREIEREMAAALEVADEAERERRRTELSPKEVPRDVSEAEMFDISGPGVMPLEASDDQREMSREMSPICPSEGDGSTVSRSVSTLQDIPEAIDELQERAEPTEPRLESPEHRETPVLFQSLLPPEADRRTVSNIFHRLLDVLSAEKLCAEQAEPYGHIHILPGRHYEQLLQDQ